MFILNFLNKVLSQLKDFRDSVVAIIPAKLGQKEFKKESSIN